MRHIKILARLKEKYPRPRISLEFSTPFELLVATILSAQCTDVRVNKVTESLFEKYQCVEDYVSANEKKFQADIRSTGFYCNKARNIIAAAKIVVEDFKGKVPDMMDELIKLPGVARKTANVVLFNAFRKNEGIAVDTHVIRVTNRLGLTLHKEPEKIEKDLMLKFEKKEWGLLSLRFILHGRQTCMARSPRCTDCCLVDICPSRKLFLRQGIIG